MMVAEASNPAFVVAMRKSLHLYLEYTLPVCAGPIRSRLEVESLIGSGGTARDAPCPCRALPSRTFRRTPSIVYSPSARHGRMWRGVSAGGGAKVGRGVKGWGYGMWAWGAVVGGRARGRRVCGHGDEPTFRALGPRCCMPLLVIPFAVAVTINQGGMVPVPPFPRAAVARCVHLESIRLQHVRGRGAAASRSEEQGEGAGQAECLHGAGLREIQIRKVSPSTWHRADGCSPHRARRPGRPDRTSAKCRPTSARAAAC